MNFLHPEFLWLAPLLAVPILIHLLNRVRYRRMRWAAIEFLLATERRAIRRARLRQILLMALRVMVLAGALGALAQPIFSGGLASLLGGSTQVAVLLDSSASMSATDASGSAFDRAKKMAAADVAALPRGVRAVAGTFSSRYDSALRDPIQDHGAVAASIESCKITSGGTDVPGALREAADALARGGGGGTIWLLTDLRENGWRAGGAGAWAEVRQAVEKAGRPRIVISDAAPPVAANTSISKLGVAPQIVLDGDSPRLTATVRLDGGRDVTTHVRLFFDDKSIDARSVHFAESGAADVVFRLPPLRGGPHAGHLELEQDAVPADDRFYFVLRPAASAPVLVVSGVPSTATFDGSADFLVEALHPPASEGARSPFAVKVIQPRDLADTPLGDYAAVCLADVPRIEAEAVQALRAYAIGGGLVMVFPGAHTEVAAWKDAGLPGTRIEALVAEDGDKRRKVGWTSPASPVTASLAAEGLDRLLIARHFRLASDPACEVLATVDGGGPLIVRSQLGKGKVYAFSISCQLDFSNLPLTPVFLLTVHRIVLNHMVDVGDPLAQPAMAALELVLKPGAHRIIMPDGRALPLSVRDGAAGKALFEQTQEAGIYRLASGEGADAVKPTAPASPGQGPAAPGRSPAAGAEGTAADAAAGYVARRGGPGVPVAAVNVPQEESSLARIEPGAVRDLLPGVVVSFLGTDGGASRVAAEGENPSAASGFPLAVLALILLVGEVVVAWTMGRPSRAAPKNEAASRAAA